MKNNRRLISMVLILVSVPFLLKSISLFGMIKDGDGIGLYFLGLEINDKILFGQIPIYSWSFFIIALVLIFISISLLYKSIKYKSEHQ